jgi:hypothetical protein
MNKKLLTELQLQAGGSHYPSINPQMQEAFARLVVEECINVVANTSKNAAYTTHDLDIVMQTLNNSINDIKQRFEL